MSVGDFDNALVTLTTANTGNVSTGLDYYRFEPATPTVTWTAWPSTYYYHTCVSHDRGEKAFKLAQALVEKKLVEAKSAGQFIKLMQTILETI